MLRILVACCAVFVYCKQILKLDYIVEVDKILDLYQQTSEHFIGVFLN